MVGRIVAPGPPTIHTCNGGELQTRWLLRCLHLARHSAVVEGRDVGIDGILEALQRNTGRQADGLLFDSLKDTCKIRPGYGGHLKNRRRW
eukprot:5372309-Prymnesium_polylepis.1